MTYSPHTTDRLGVVLDKRTYESSAINISDFRRSQTKTPERYDILTDDAFYIDSVLSSEDCSSLIEQTEKIGYTYWDSSGCGNSYFRDVCTIEIKHPELANYIWENVKKKVVDIISIQGEDSPKYELDLIGEWIPCGINDNFLFARYDEGKSFGPHTDGTTIIDINHRSMFSVVIYLCDTKKGGETKIYSEEQRNSKPMMSSSSRYIGDPKYLIGEVGACAGRFLAFHCDVMHEGAPLGKNEKKYIIRTDIMYRRKDPILTSDVDKEAFKLWTDAQVKAEKGEIDEAQQMFRRAFRISPGLKILLKM